MRKYLNMNCTLETRQEMYKIVTCLLDIFGLPSRKAAALRAYMTNEYSLKEYREWISKELDGLDDVLKEAYDRNKRVNKIKTSYKDWLDIDWKHDIDIQQWKRRKAYNEKYNQKKETSRLTAKKISDSLQDFYMKEHKEFAQKYKK